MQWPDSLTRLFDITYPVIQAPMLGITTPAMVAEISNNGGLGSLPVGGQPPEKTAALIREVKALTSKPFAVNLFTYEMPPRPHAATFDRMQEFLQFLYGANRLAAPPVDMDSIRIYSYKEQVPVLLAEGIKAVSYTFGMPDAESMAQLKSAGCILTGTATSVAEAAAVAAAGADAVVMQGIEAGGHRGSFLAGELPLVGMQALVRQAVNRTGIPVIAAGGIGDGKGIAAALMLGAAGVQLGSVFLRSPESAAGKAHKEHIAAATDTATRLTRVFTGRWARGIPNLFMEEIEASGLMLNQYPIQDVLTQPMRQVARELDNTDFTVMWAGQSAHMAPALPAAVIFRELVTATEKAWSYQ
ncbi:NAD(P)H-dependent flavin oxidoreductase [Chitinophaga solisilvae]|uniref:NAD(P)H-dependent flavin oxidoreductase n=1 Tax=Chitinophaga solisilvae TaxID=1233460 RepID=UPI0013719A2F|nr:nitronate monooxygenase [Chitinophaga solisilvae]